MIRLPDIPLHQSAAKQLESWQALVDALPTYSERVDAAARQFKSRNRRSDPTFDAVRTTLAKMCSGPRRCAYCEDSAADEVEHVRPKALYPEAVFAWTNYLYACGPCNGPKHNRFEVFVTGILTDVTRAPKGPVLPPPPGVMVIIDPRAENALDFLQLDLSGTFLFVPRSGLSNSDQVRATRTIVLLGLNSRDYLPLARGQMFDDYLRHLEAYVSSKHAGGTDLLARAARLSQRGHPTVWHEMKRQRDAYPKLAELFDSAPELL